VLNGVSVHTGDTGYAAGLGYALVEIVGKFSFVAAAWSGLEERRWLIWIEENVAVMMGYLSSKSGSSFR